MNRKQIFLPFGIGLLGVLFFANRWYGAESLQWELMNRVPTSTVAESKRLGVFEAALKPSPEYLHLGTSEIRITDAWVEHRTTPIRRGMFNVEQENSPDLVLCLQLKLSGKSDVDHAAVKVKVGDVQRTFGPPFRDNICIEVGRGVPTGVVFSSDDGSSPNVKVMFD